MRTLFSFLLIALVSTGVSAATITGFVMNAESGDPIIGANVYLDDTPYGVVTGTDGAFRITGVPDGAYRVTASHVGYTVYKKRVTVDGDFSGMTVFLQPEVLSGQTVVVTATRAKDRETPVTFSNLSREDIEQRYSTQDVPMLLQTMPSAYAYSDAGNGVGYSYLKIRGFDQKRINVLINGIPHNGPTSHEVYWIDMPDLLANAEDVQVQRGVGNSLFGSNALGGTVNIITNNYNTEPSISAYMGTGSFATRKYSFALNSGLAANRYVMYGRFSRITSDGYRDQSWTRLSSYFFGVARYDENMTTKVHIYGGPEETHLSYYGVTRDYLEGNISGDRRVDRRHNPLTYENELDTFTQPHYELHHDWQVTPKVRLGNTLYTIKGEGEYDQFRRDRDFTEFRLPTFSVADPNLYPSSWYRRDANGNPEGDEFGRYTITKSDLIRKRWVQNDEYGWLPRVTLDHRNGSLTVGGELRLHEGLHRGTITWLGATPPNVTPGYEYYRYTENKRTVSAFIHESYGLTPFVTLMGDVQAVSHTYRLGKDPITSYEHETTYRWLSPKFGVNINLTDRIHTFASIAHAQREPISSDLVDPQDYWNVPNFTRADTLRTGGEVTAIRLSDPTVEPERMVNVEVGAGYRSPSLSLSANVYHMDFRNEIVPWVGQINEDSGLPATGNADRSVHQGIEIEFGARPASFFELSGNLNVNADRFINYTEHAMDWDAWETVSVVRDGNRIALFPAVLGNLRGTVSLGGASASVAWRYVGRQYLDNSETTEYSIDPFHTTDLIVAYEFGRRWGVKNLRIELQITNVFDRLYAAGGYMDDVYAVASEGKVYGTPYFIPAATRSAFLSMQWKL